MHPGGIDLLALRRRFIDRRAVPEGLIAAPILRSWQRCAAQGLDMEHPPRDILPMTTAELRGQREKNEYLRRISRSELDMLGSEGEIASSVVILTDPSGLVLDMAGNLDFARDAMRVALRPGVVWAEAMTGTNAIGTAAVEGCAVAVRGAEHYFGRHQSLTCSAAPIFDPAGKIVGLLDISGAANDGQGHALGLVKLAALEIEHRLFREGFEDKTVVRFHTAQSHLGTAREAVLVFDGDRIVAANRTALALLGLTRGQLQNREPRELFGKFSPGETLQNLRGPGGIPLFARISGAQERIAPAAKRQSNLQSAAPILRGQVEPVVDAALRGRIGEAARLLDADIPVLIMGETGSGKDVFARAAHAASQRAKAPFVAINCAALPETLIEAELFGYEEGAFTGAKRGGREGLLQQAAGGVLFLDEIGDMPLALQSRLLRVVQDRCVTPLGAGRSTPVDFALICATHRPLRALVNEGGFRADLFYRIAQYRVELPPLRESADLAGAIGKLWSGLGAEAAGVKLSAEAEALLLRHPWPGNWRELVATLRAAIALAGPGGVVTPRLLPAEITEAPMLASHALPIAGTLDEVTDATLRSALAAAGGNVSRAARKLGVDRSTFYRRVIRRA